MPARSKSQQRLFGMVHAYNKGEFSGSKALQRRVASLARRISDETARHFAETPHGNLPERKEKRASAPSYEDLRRMYDVVQADARLFRRLRLLGLADSVRAGRRVRNRIVHQPGYVPSAADADMAIRDYSAAGRRAAGAEKRAQSFVRPDEVRSMYASIEPRIEAMAYRISDRSRKRRSFLGHVVSGTSKGALWGSILGGLGVGALGVGLASHAAGVANTPPDEVNRKLIDAAIRCGLWGVGRGALFGSAAGMGLGVLNSIRE